MTKSKIEKNTFKVWEGIYESFPEARKYSIGSGFSGEKYSVQAIEVAKECLNCIEEDRPIKLFHKQRFTIFPTVVSFLIGKKANKGRLKILDIGGGLAIAYMSLIESIPGIASKIDYSILEIPSVCNIASKFWKTKNYSIEYLDSIPKEMRFDLLFSSSALQYIEDWRDFIKVVTQHTKSHFLLSDVFCGKINSFVTLQNYYDSKIPHWFLSEKDLIKELSLYNFFLQSKTFATGERAGIHNHLYMENFPKKRRIDNTVHLLFSREKYK